MAYAQRVVTIPEASTAELLVPASAAPPPATRPGLLDRDWLKLLVPLLTVLAGAALMWAIWQVITPIFRTLILFALSAVVAFALGRPVKTLELRLGRRVPAIAVIYLVVAAIVLGGLVLLAGPFVSQAAALVEDIPRWLGEVEARAPEMEGALGRYGIRATADDLRARAALAVEEGGLEVVGHLAGALTEVGALFADVVLALFISFYLVKDGPDIRRRVLRAVPERHREKALFLEENIARVVGGYLRGQLLLAVSIGLLAGLGCWALGLPYAVVLGVLAGLFELVPMFGPILSSVPALVVALFMPFPTIVWVALFFIIIQQLENNVLMPRVTGHAVGLHPLGALFALLAGFQTAGVIGALFAVPLAGVAWVLVQAAYRDVVAPPVRPATWSFPWRTRRP